MAAEERLSRLDSQVSTDASPPEINSAVQESGQTSVAGGNDVYDDREEFEQLVNESSLSFWSDTCSSFEDGTWKMELEKFKNLMPSDIFIDYYDVLVLYSEDNKSDARIFCEHLKNDIKLNSTESVKAVLYDEFVPQAGSKLKLLETALERCTYIFFYITKEFCKDKWIELSSEECLIETIENEEKRWCVVPVITVPIKTADFKIPFGLKCLRSIRYYEKNNDYYQDVVSKLITHKLPQRKGKERIQEQKQFTWLQSKIRTIPVGIKNIQSWENKKKLRTGQQGKKKISEEAMKEGFSHLQPVLLQIAGVQTGTDPQPSSTNSERRNSDKMDNRNQSVRPTYNNSIKSTDQLSQAGSANHMEPATHKFSLISKKLPDSPMLHGQESTMTSSSINSNTGENRPIQEESHNEATSDEWVDTDSDPREQPSSIACRKRRDSDNGYHSDQSGEPVSQKKEQVCNIYRKSADQLSQGGSTNHMEPTSHKFSTIGLQDIGFLSLNPDVDGMCSTSEKQDSQMTPRCWSTKATVEEEKEQSLEIKSVKKTKEDKNHYSSPSEGFVMEINKKDLNSHLESIVKDSKKKLVVTVTPRPVCKDRDGEKTDGLDVVAREKNGDTGVETIKETRRTTVDETELDETSAKILDDAISRISPFREKLQTELYQYQVTKRPAAPLLAKASPITPVTPFAAKITSLLQIDSTSVQHIESDELD